ncbi:unnamed protein product [Linum tenue]|nr:unnamed protein product [Linum tenue]
MCFGDHSSSGSHGLKLKNGKFAGSQSKSVKPDTLAYNFCLHTVVYVGEVGMSLESRDHMMTKGMRLKLSTPSAQNHSSIQLFI